MINLFDEWLELRIRMATKKDLTQPENWKHFCKLIGMRSNRQVERMERVKGLIR